MRHRPAFAISLIAVLVLPAVVAAQPSISSLTPAAIAPGKVTEVTIHGAKLERPLQIWTSFPAEVELIAPANEEEGKKVDAVRCKITPAAGVSVGVAGIAVGNKSAVSAIHFFLIDDLPVVTDNGDNHSSEKAQLVELPAGVNGTIDGSYRDYYAFEAAKGQRVAVEILASRIGSTMDPVVRLLDGQGNELAMADDNEGLGADCRFSRTLEQPGRYVVEVADNKFQGGLRYSLRLGDFPIVTAPFPLGAVRGESAELGFLGQDQGDVESLQLTIPADLPSERLAIGARFPGGASSAMTVIAVDSLAEQVEAEPNDDPGQGTEVSFPGAVSGGLLEAGDKDHFSFNATKGQVLNFRTLARSLGSAAYLQLRVLNAEGSQLATTTVSDAAELSLRYTVPDDGKYFLVVDDLLRRGGPEFVYRVAVTLGSSFSLTLKNDKATVNQFVVGKGNGGFAFPITVGRTGYDGPITISLEPALEGVQIWNGVIAEKAKEARPIVVIPQALEEGDLRMLRVVGTATVDGVEQKVVMRSEAWLRTKHPAMLYPPAWYDGLLSMGTSAPVEPFYDFKAPSESVTFARQVGQVNCPLTLERKHKDFKAGMNVFFQQLPEGFSASVKADKDTYTVTLSGPADAAAGELSFRIACFGEFNGKGQTIFRDVPITVVDPISVTLTPVGALLVGQKQKVKIEIVRAAGSEPQDVTLSWTKLPAGVSGDETITIAKDKSEVEVELAAAADAAAIVFEELTAQAKTTYAGKEVTAESPAAKLEVK